MGTVMDEMAAAMAEVEGAAALGGVQRFKLTDPSTKFAGVFTDEERAVAMLESGYSDENVATLRATVAQFSVVPVWNERMRIWWVDRTTWYRVESVELSGPHYEFKLRVIKS